MSILGYGFDPGVVNAFCAYAQENLFVEISTIDIVDCNDNRGATFRHELQFEINIREVTQRGRYWKSGKWIEEKFLRSTFPP